MSRARGVYPRVGGGNILGRPPTLLTQGLSPRGRGKLDRDPADRNDWRSIPAWAGETVQADALAAPVEVYPRVGGGNPLPCALITTTSGLSPRGRGKHEFECVCGVHKGSIPAWAGETPGKFFCACLRACIWSIPAWAGETSRRIDTPELNEVYPRVGGGNIYSPSGVYCPRGLSPRGRGKLSRRLYRRQIFRSIPAWAGETRNPAATHRLSRVYPRVGGGNSSAKSGADMVKGLSPRGRGKP